MEHSPRHRLSAALDPEMRKQPGLSPANQAVIGGILVLVIIAILETEVQILGTLGWLMESIKLVLFVCFAVEYMARLWIAPLNPRYRSALHYALTPSALVDLLVLVTFVTPFLGLEASVFRLLQLARLLRLAKMGRYSRSMALLYDAIRSRGTELTLSFGMAFSLMLGAATLLYIVEAEGQPDAFGSIPRAMWWAVATLTTVGYGDVVPMTALGRVLAALTALCGIGIIALPTGVLAGAFSDAIRRAREDRNHPHHRE